MRTREISDDEALLIASRQESHFFDRKACGIKGAKVQKIAVAFANADGGEFVLGVADDKDEPNPEKRWNGFASLEDMNGLLQAVFEITPSLDLRYEILNCQAKPGHVLRVSVEKSSDVHKTADGTVYQRHGAQSLPIKDPQKITELTFAKGASSFEDQLLKDIPAELVVESEELAKFLKHYSPKTDPLEFCVNQNLLDFKTWTPRVASVLLFHPSPSGSVPRKCGVKVTRYETKEDDPERDHLSDQLTIEGPLYQQILATIAGIKQIMESVTIWTAEGLKNVEYPPEALWETVVNRNS